MSNSDGQSRLLALLGQGRTGKAGQCAYEKHILFRELRYALFKSLAQFIKMRRRNMSSKIEANVPSATRTAPPMSGRTEIHPVGLYGPSLLAVWVIMFKAAFAMFVCGWPELLFFTENFPSKAPGQAEITAQLGFFSSQLHFEQARRDMA